MNTEQLKQAENEVTIEGILSEINIHKDTSARTHKEFIGGEVKVKATIDIYGTPTELEIPVRVFANKNKNDGGLNPSYESIERLSQMTSLAAVHGDYDKADRVRFERATIRANDFYGRNGMFVSYPTITASFARKVSVDEYVPKADFANVIVIGNLKEELDKDKEPTGRLIVTGILPQYGGKVDKIDYVVSNESAIKYITQYWHKGDTVRIVGIINFSYGIQTKAIEMGFGGSEIKTQKFNVYDLLITKGSESSSDESAYDIDLITKAIEERQARLNEMKMKAEQSATASRGDTTDFGF